MNLAEQTLQESGIIAIARGIASQWADAMTDALLTGGIHMLEITMNTDGAGEMIRALRTAYEGRMIIGAGTVTTMERLQDAIDAGAQFIVTPNVNEDVIRFCTLHDILITPGALTPTEICRAMSLGCKYIKLFPASCMGPAYLKAVRAALSDATLLVVGGISHHNLEDYLMAGAYGAGVGGNLCRMRAAEDAEAIVQEASALIDVRRRLIMGQSAIG